MRKNELFWMIGGAQGSGVDSSANTFAKTCAAGGLHVFGKREYHSNIKGEHSYFQIRVDSRPVRSHVDDVHLLATFDRETVEAHKHEVVPGGGIIYDPSLISEQEIGRKDLRLYPVPYNDIIKEVAKEFNKEASKLQIMKNVISVAASFALLDFDFSLLQKTLEGVFKGKKAAIGTMNVKAGEKVYHYMKQKSMENPFPWKLEKIPATEPRIFLQGTTATAIGKLAAGCRFQTYYPITPATDESEFLEAHPEFGTVVVQSEDEIAAIAMAIGAGLAGARSSTSTSGPGLCLMIEGLGWAGMNEVPVTVFDYQRGGPSTGLPTRFEQGDLKFAVSAGHGDFPRFVLAPGDLTEYFYVTIDAFNYAERYQTPVIVLTDKAMANANQTIPFYDLTKARIDRGEMVTEQDLLKYVQGNGTFKRFAFTESGISPRSIPGQLGGMFWNTGDEHTEVGHITEDSDGRIRMMDKRMRKLETALKEIPVEKQVSVFGSEQADLSIVSWGSTKGAILDAMEDLGKEHGTVNFLQIRLIHPFPVGPVTAFLKKAKRKVIIENNYSGQLEGIIRQNTGIAMDHHVRKWNGRPISRDEVMLALKEEILAESKERVVLSRGV